MRSVSEVTIDHDSPEPPFEQVRRKVAALSSSGTWPPGHRLPPVRVLAAELGIAVNTAAKAYKALESDGVVETHGRRGTVVAMPHVGDPQAASAAVTFVATARRQGLSRDEAHRLVDDAWS